MSNQKNPFVSDVVYIARSLTSAPEFTVSYRRCNTRPHYGISRGKAVYCVTHKLDGMVHLLKEAKTLQKKAHAL